MWDYLPQRIYNIGAQFVDSMAKINGGDQTAALKYFYSIIDITKYVDEQRTWSEPKKLEEIEYEINKIVNKNTIKRGLTIGTCLKKSFDIDDLGEVNNYLTECTENSNGFYDLLYRTGLYPDPRLIEYYLDSPHEGYPRD